MSFVALTLIYFATLANAGSCLTSSEDFAAEVVIPEYDFIKAQILGDMHGGEVWFPSIYTDHVIVIVSETDTPNGLSIRLQRPTEVREVKKPHLKIASLVQTGTLRDTFQPVLNGWRATCDVRTCTFEKELMTLTASRGKENKIVTFEINQGLAMCSSSCSGFCATLGGDNICFDARIKQDLDTLMRYTNLTTSFKSLLGSYRLIGTEGITVADITPTSADSIDWSEAMREELVNLNKQEITNLSREAIESIALQAQEGRAGRNYRIVFNNETSEWIPYQNTPNAVESTQRDCRSYALSAGPTVKPALAPFYVIPLILTLAGFLVLGLLIIIARVLTKRKKRKTAHKNL